MENVQITTGQLVAQVYDLITPDMGTNTIDAIAELTGQDRDYVLSVIDRAGLWRESQFMGMSEEEYSDNCQWAAETIVN